MKEEITGMTGTTEVLLDPRAWPASIWAALLLGVATIAVQVFWRPSLPKNAPKWWRDADWPVVGALQFYSNRKSFFERAIAGAPNGVFSFYVGKKHIVGLSGAMGRKALFEEKELNFGAGITELFTAMPVNQSKVENFTAFFNKSLGNMLRRENFVRNLDGMTGDVRRAFAVLAAAAPSAADPAWRVTSPFDSMYRVVYQLTMRTLGAEEVAQDAALLDRTLALFETFEKTTSTAKIIFPWLPTPSHLYRLYNGARLAIIFQGVVNKRRKSGTRCEDALQFLMDTGAPTTDIVAFLISTLFAGQVNSGVFAAWLQVWLAMYPTWKARVREEVDAAAARRRTRPEESTVDMLDTLTVEEWEAEFPLVDLCLREAIRLGLPGMSCRKNLSDHDIPIAGTGEVIPPGAFATYLMDDVSRNPDIYTDPDSFDPGRYLDGRNEDKKVPHGYLGWGSGRHPCLGMRFAKLEMTLITAYFVGAFDFELSDARGRPLPAPPCTVNPNQLQAEKPAVPIYLRYRPRS